MTDLSEVQHGACPNSDCDGEVQTSAFQHQPLIACPRMKSGEIFLKGQLVNEEQEEYLQELDCPMVTKLREGENGT